LWTACVRAGCSAVLLLVAACATLEAPSACPPIKAYDLEFNAAFANQLDRLPLPEYWAIAEALNDYYLLRRLAERCVDMDNNGRSD
jgi:hypothetical protein